MNPRTNKLIQILELKPHPEGGFFRETFRAPLKIEGHPLGQRRNASTAIYFLLTAGTFSAWHRVRGSDEIWHFYDGDPLDLHMLDGSGTYSKVTLGNKVLENQQPQVIVPAGVWQAAVSLGRRHTLCGCTVAPGFDFSDFDIASAKELLSVFPSHAEIIQRYTRS